MIRSIPKIHFVRLGWTTVGFGLVQFLRLINNVVLTHLLAPAMFGLMLIVVTVRTAFELFSDVGIGQNIVSNPKGEDPDYYDTAWTLQFIRGILLASIFTLSAGAVAAFFEQPALQQILPVVALTLIFAGADSTGKALIHKRMGIPRMAKFEVSMTAFAVVAQISLALVMPTIWALVIGIVLQAAASLVSSYCLIPGMRHRFVLHREHVRDLLVFGKWIFLSSVIYFLAMSFDRLYFAKTISLAELGIYGVARSLADLPALLALRCAQLILFPQVASMNVDTFELRQRLRHGRRAILVVAAVGMGLLVATSDLAVRILYDHRFEPAGTILPLLLIGIWFGILNSFTESLLMGIRQPAYPAVANGTKLAVYVLAVPFAYMSYGFEAAVLALGAGEVAKYIILWLFSRGQHLGFSRDDVGLTLIFIMSIVIFREALSLIGLTGDLRLLFPAIFNIMAAF